MTTPKRGDEIPAPPPPTAPTSRRFVGKVALVTGAARGQGRAEAVRFAAEGADVIALDICRTLETTKYPGATPADLAETVALVEKYDRRIVAREVDTRDFDALAAAVREGVAELGGLDVVVANAGMTAAARAWEIDADHWRETIDINLTGAFHTAKATVPILLEQGRGGSIVFTGSVSSVRGLPFLAAYVAAKHGVLGLAKTLANELAEYRIRVNTVIPHGVDTDLRVPELFELMESAPQQQLLYIPSLPDQKSTVDDIAAAIAWLASDEARHVTGIELPVDLGRTNR
ncbi:mycofactocin-coupled SDR family oxidoreductase [Nocardia sp. NBC_00565]|uniref:mycofactocin-coupled SDR family oxidoreductase n=1 Tax=Nocardia sp. NBC_00565 TaxID=2975993 RepID=UPI002E81D8EB|nr:mycofactocin-coupled SDR family oxidoreductase [Nocardia sp. NBC_00565]WUC05803.1 mycofactocin-coupled SDR family oxidoreductase [Nocardia sp. NBC_00565]